MADNTRVNELQDKLLKAMDILNAQALNSISFDKTITCKIENDKDKKDGKYEVNDGNRIFAAYSTDTRLRAGDTVYVTVPEGNFENQKMIIGKKTADNDKPFNFTQPFDTFFDMTGNIITPDKIKEENKELIANSIEDKDALIENCKTSTWLIGSKDTNGDIVMTDVSNKDLIKYTRLAVRADFRTWIKNAVRGEYGINIYLRTSKPKTVSAENNAIENNEQIIEQGDYKYNWNNSMMYGNTYNFETYYSQEIVLDLEKQDIGRVDGIAIEFYQKANFYDKFNEPIPTSEDGFKTKDMSNEYERYLDGNGYYIEQGNKLSPNIFIDNFYLSFGYDISTFTDDFVEIYTQNTHSYTSLNEVDEEEKQQRLNQKEIKMRWVHLKDAGPIDMVNGGETSLNYEVRWYRYSVGATAADKYCGIYWKRIEDATGFAFSFNPDVNKAQEKIKAIVIYENNIPYRSNELIFENDKPVQNSEDLRHIINALTIETDDDSNGNYMIYGQDNSIKDTEYGKTTRTMTAYFDANNDGEINKETETIYDFDHLVWKFPIENTMIQLLNGGSYEKIDLIQYEKDKYYIKDNNDYKLSNGDAIDSEKIYYSKNEKGEYIEVNNLYRPNCYYVLEYSSTANQTYNDKIVYYELTEEQYKPVRNVTLDNFNNNKTNYYILGYKLTNAPYDGTKEYYYYNQNSGIVTNEVPQYKIKSYYSPSYSNNTVQCQYTLNGVVYTTEKEFTFGPTGTMGTDQTLVIDFVGDKNAIDINDINLKYQLQVQLYDNQNKLVTDFQDAVIEWSFYYQSDNKLTITSNNEDKTKADLTFGDGFDKNSLYIAKVKIGKLETYFPLPIKDGYSYIKGPTQVIYQADGEPAYNREEYKLYDSSDSIQRVKWRIRLDREGYKYTQVSNKNLNQEDLEAGLYYDENYKWINPSGHTLNNKNKYYTRDETTVKQRCYKNSNTTAITQIGGEDGFIAANTEKYWPSLSNSNNLQPLTIYVKDAPVYGVQAIDNSNNVLWTQPILVLQNQWPNGVVNAWDGETLKLDYETQTVLAAAISAGKKNSEDNTFSGVMMGDWGTQDVAGEIASQTGLYGFHHGAMSYAFKEDGTAFIGKSSVARINFDGSNATIYSSGYNTSAGGMMINLYNGGEPYISLKSSGNSDSDDYSEMRFDTKTSGSTIKLKRKEIEINGEKYTGGDIIISNEDTLTPLKIGNDFSVSWQGSIKANSGKIGSWNIIENTLQSNDKNIILSTENQGSISIGDDVVLDASGSGSINIGNNIELNASGSGTIYIGSNSSNRITISASNNGTISMGNNSILTGGIIKAGTLQSNSDSSWITLEGYLSVGDGTLGYVASNSPVAKNPDGIGMTYGENLSRVIATGANAALGFGSEGAGNYVSVESNYTSIGHSSKIEINCTGANNSSNRGIWIQGNSSKTTHLHIYNIPAQNQHGIYARFA